eukprot:1154968-Pelagomonas_calceolata.AAC.5
MGSVLVGANLCNRKNKLRAFIWPALFCTSYRWDRREIRACFRPTRLQSIPWQVHELRPVPSATEWLSDL